MEEDKINPLKRLVLIGGSAGSLEVILQLLPNLNYLGSLAIVLILHRRNSDDNILEELLRMKSGLPIVEIEDKTPIQPGCIYVAPADYHLLFEENLTFSLDVSEKVHYSRPSIDVGFESAALVFGHQLIAILLSGANSDGTTGLRVVKKNEGTVVVQSPETAEVPFMPEYALKHLEPDYVLSPKEMAAFIKELAH